MDRSVALIHAPVDMDSTMKVPAPLGLLYLGAVLRGRGIPVCLFDFHHEGTSWAAVEAAVGASERCLVGFSCRTNNVYRALHLSERLLARFANVTVVLGGPHVTHLWEPYVTGRRVVVRGEGEHPMLLLAQQVLEGEGSLQDIPGLAYCVGGEVRANPISLGPFEDVDAIAFPDYSLLPSGEFYLPAIATTRGCPYACFFCSEGHRPYRARSAENVERELGALKEQYDGRVPYLAFNDDTFTVAPARVNEMCDVLDRVFPDKSRFGFCCEARADVLAHHPELIARLKEAGLVAMQIGIESGNQALLDAMNKRVRVDQIEAVVAHCNDADVPYIAGNFICGLPGQTREDVENEIAFAKRLADLAPERIELTMKPLMPYPGTEYRRNASKWGLSILDGDFVTGRTARASFVATAHLSKEQIEESCQRFMVEVGDYIMKQAAPRLSPQNTKELLILAAETSQRTFVVNRLCYFMHVGRLLMLRRREDHRFLLEIAEHLAPKCAPVAVAENAVAPSGEGVTVNRGSPLEFELTTEQMTYYRYFVGRLSFEEIARRTAGEKGVAEEQTFKECMDVYMECEDCLAAIILI